MTANAISIDKKEDYTLRNNYRPISLLSKINKAVTQVNLSVVYFSI